MLIVTGFNYPVFDYSLDGLIADVTGRAAYEGIAAGDPTEEVPR